jgi:cytochrome bd-type quinol oxidase subunit 1
MDLDPTLVARLQFAFTIIFHIIFPTFTKAMSSFGTAMVSRNSGRHRLSVEATPTSAHA